MDGWTMKTSRQISTNRQEELIRLLPELTLAGAVSVLSNLAQDHTFWAEAIQPLLRQPWSGLTPTIAHTIGGYNGSAVLQIYAWPPGATTAIHDHASWGALHCLLGVMMEERYERLDNGAEPDHAHLRLLWERQWVRQDGVSTFLPYEAGIHRISNRGEQVAFSIHVYGARQGPYDGRDYDPATDSVCNRLEE